jgi:hypothetical protein
MFIRQICKNGNESVCSIKYSTNFLGRLTHYRSFGEELQHEPSHFSLKPYFKCRLVMVRWERYSFADLLEGERCLRTFKITKRIIVYCVRYTLHFQYHFTENLFWQERSFVNFARKQLTFRSINFICVTFSVLFLVWNFLIKMSFIGFMLLCFFNERGCFLYRKILSLF